MRKRSLLIKTVSLLSQDLAAPYNAYAKKKKISKYLKPDKHELRLIVKTIFEEIGKQMVESKGGVFIRNFGYFFVWKTPHKDTYGKHYKHNIEKDTELYNHHSQHYVYKPTFIPAGGHNNLRYWSMDNKFSKPVRDGINRQIRSGHKYTSYVYTLRKPLNLR